MLLNNFIAVAVLGLASSASAFVGPSTGVKCGYGLAACPKDQVCVADNPKCTKSNRCPRTCHYKNRYKSCGGFVVKPKGCRKGLTCQDDPRFPDSCGQACDMPGICLPKKLPECGGFLGLKCPKGKYCYDKPHDGCDPNEGGADCIGVCL
ncbi:hypothetical protein B0J13DRAFT_623785 [Dactylonectria estremocensis]|uniref:Uncharacterized protein n=1 Tax=Dactylonectria estremocensis TaxID=1079267 RepID=A0A9P9EPH2_9HYPO|nr:hypothetical protein B0J13DRAFT_623785 [Dactylonectria estremocensis]